MLTKLAPVLAVACSGGQTPRSKISLARTDGVTGSSRPRVPYWAQGAVIEAVTSRLCFLPPIEENGGCRLAIERWVNHEAVPQAAANRPKRVAWLNGGCSCSRQPRQFSWPMVFTELAWMMFARAAGVSKPALYRHFLKRVPEEYALARCWQRYAFRKGRRQQAGWGA